MMANHLLAHKKSVRAVRRIMVTNSFFCHEMIVAITHLNFRVVLRRFLKIIVVVLIDHRPRCLFQLIVERRQMMGSTHSHIIRVLSGTNGLDSFT